MNARTESQYLQTLSNQHLDALEEETIFILREVAATFERPALRGAFFSFRQSAVGKSSPNGTPTRGHQPPFPHPPTHGRIPLPRTGR
jgi:hypothetical protein